MLPILWNKNNGIWIEKNSFYKISFLRGKMARMINDLDKLEEYLKATRKLYFKRAYNIMESGK